MVQEVRLLYTPFQNFVSGHVCFVFVLQSGEQVVISPEAHTKRFNPWLGLLAFYKLTYRILEYTEYRKHLTGHRRKLGELQLALDAEQAQSLYEQMYARATKLQERGERYHILFNSCMTNSYRHARECAGTTLPAAARLIWAAWRNVSPLDGPKK